jgi:hypothetical protein
MSATGSLQFIQLAIPALVALAVVSLAHLFTVHRDRENKRREQRIGYLVSVFRALSKANHHPRLYEVADDVEQAVIDLQLFGTPEQVRLAKKFATELSTEQGAAMDELLNELRDSLRSELGREPVAGNVVWLRIHRKGDEVPPDSTAPTRQATQQTKKIT